MLTSAFFLVIMLVGVPIGLCLCLSGIFYIYSNDNAVLVQSYATQMFAGACTLMHTAKSGMMSCSTHTGHSSVWVRSV